MDQPHALVSGVMIGLAIAAPIGPMGILCIRRTLSAGFHAGLFTGAGASTVHLAYAALAAVALSGAAASLQRYHGLLEVITALVLLVFAVRMLRRRASRDASPVASGRSLLQHYLTAILFNAANPMSLALLLGATAAVFGARRPGGSEVAASLAGVFLGSILWWIALVSVTAAIGKRLSARWSRRVDLLAGLAMAMLALLALARLGMPHWPITRA